MSSPFTNNSPEDAFVATLPAATDSALDLARALSHDPELSQSLFAVRGRTIGIFGAWTPRLAQRLAALRVQLIEQLPFVQSLSFDDVQEACKRLAGQLAVEVDDQSVIVPVPRGGLIVAGLLAYELGIPRDRIRLPLAHEHPLIVDDVSISGVRMRETLDGLGVDRATVGLLAATTGSIDFLRQTFGPSVRVFADRTLADHSDQVHGDEVDGWRERWAQREADGAVLITDHLVFPWAEPDFTFWNDVTQDEDRGFRLHCKCDDREPHEQVAATVGEFPGTFDDVVWVELGDELLVAREIEGKTISYALNPESSALFQSLARSQDPDSFSGSFAEELRQKQLVR